MINLMTPLYDPIGQLLINKIFSQDIDTAERRVSRTKTLDGGVSFVDSGFADGDRTFSFGVALSKAQFETLDYYQRNYPLIRVMTTNGHFEAAIKDKTVSGETTTINLLIKSKVS